MDKLEQEKILFDEIAKVLEHFTQEYDMTYGQILGVLKLIEADVIESNRENQGN